jgi:hypothetical protein
VCRLFRHPVKKAGFLSRVCFFCCTVFGDGQSFCAKMWKKGVCRCLEQKKNPLFTDFGRTEGVFVWKY